MNSTNITNTSRKQDANMDSLTETKLDLHEARSTGQRNSGGRDRLEPPKELLLSVEPPASVTVTDSPVRRPLREHKVNSSIIPAVIPPERDLKHRMLILCFDGTGDHFDENNSNIVQLCTTLKKEDRSKQMIYYQSGIGTYTSPAIASPMKSKVSKLMNKLVAKDLNAHVMDGYEFLMQNYTEGDRICMFGFSRGAYTARSLAGMLHKVGLLTADNFQQVPFAYKMYLKKSQRGFKQSSAFKQAFCRDVTIEFLGVWDTVDSVGLINKRLPFTTSNTIVRTFRHAISLDERRCKFKPNFWELPHCSPENSREASPPTHPSYSTNSSAKGHARTLSTSSKQRQSPLSFEWENPEDKELTDCEEQFSLHSENTRPTDVKEVWFAGCHCDVGGGSVQNFTRHSLARISLRWMIRECFSAKSGIMFYSERLKAIGLDVTALHPFLTPRLPPLSGKGQIIKPVLQREPTLWRQILALAQRKPKPRNKEPTPQSAAETEEVVEDLNTVQHLPEEEEELRDSLSPKYDQLKLVPAWWILELLPMEYRYQKKCDEWVTYFGFVVLLCFLTLIDRCVCRCNLARPRLIPDEKPNKVLVHRSVKIRMDAEKTVGKCRRYLPKTTLPTDSVIWVD
ncbi:hypothetical protein BDP27DRAFT_1309702 [Rhodocollybia butyracea]|uniref:T6SS Phospholipase effector Tle1-like catalytic domain-containing protein n=1 Tax=Rhodocollybia butyracea TaxID=206335 RepID=A0A9P5QAC3_9AGAR|nr:hypothetical protein BDP27DRAFT_1309702 [Rhodocollybia butyracea]